MKRKRSRNLSIGDDNQGAKRKKLPEEPGPFRGPVLPKKGADICTVGISCYSLIKFDFTSPRTVFESLIAPVAVDDFFANFWERKPLVIPVNNCSSEALRSKNQENTTGTMSDIFSMQILESILENHRLTFVRDINVVRYVDRMRLDMNGNGRLTVRKFRRSFHRDRGTVQIHQPQRFQDNLWQIMENLESFFGCLVGANVYMTPSKSQGLPPHHDDVEVFVVQLEGKKHWRLYEPIVALPREYSGDISELDLGQPIVDVVLKPGDVMYFPRGTIHQACTETKHGHSTHVTISTYQRQTWGDYLLSIFPSMLEEASSKDIAFRRGLPINFCRSAKLPKSSKMHSVVDLLLGKLKFHRFIPPETMIEDFMWNRLPPFQVDAENLRNSLPTGFPPNQSSKVRLKYPYHVCCLVKKDSPVIDGNSDDDEEGDLNRNLADNLGYKVKILDLWFNSEGNSDTDGEEDEIQAANNVQSNAEMLYVYTSLFNDRASHMMGQNSLPQINDAKGLALKFPAHLLDAVEFLRTRTSYCSASKLPVDLPVHAEQLLCSLWSSHLLEARQKKSPVQGKRPASKNCKIKQTNLLK